MHLHTPFIYSKAKKKIRALYCQFYKDSSTETMLKIYLIALVLTWNMLAKYGLLTKRVTLQY